MREILRPLRILQVSTSDRRGGAEGIARALRDEYRDAGHESWLAVGHPSGDDPQTFALDVRRRRLLSALDRRLGLEEMRFPGTRRLLDVPPHVPDVVQLHNMHGWYFDLRRLPSISGHVPVVLTLHDMWLLTGHCAHSFDCTRWLAGCGLCPDLSIYPAIARDSTARNWRRKRAIYARSRLRIATPSRWLMEKVERSMLAQAALEFRVIPNGVELDVFTPGDRRAARASLGIGEHEPVVLFAAAGVVANPWKDWETVREAVALLSSRLETPPLLLALGDEGPSERVGASELRFLGYRADPADVARVYQAADVYVHAALADTFPTTVMEALASGLPVVATAVGGVPEQIRDGETGILVQPRSPRELADALAGMFSNPEARMRMGSAAADDARQRFDIRRTAAAYLEWFEGIVAC